MHSFSRLVLALALTSAASLAPSRIGATISSTPSWLSATTTSEPAAVTAADVARQLLELSEEKQGLEAQVSSLSAQLDTAKSQAVSAERGHKLALSELESMWRKTVDGLKAQINDLGADLARERLQASRDAAAAAEEIAVTKAELATTKASLLKAEKEIAATTAAAAAEAFALAREAAKADAVASALGKTVASRDATIEIYENKGVRALSKDLAGKIATKTASGASKTVDATKAGAAASVDLAKKGASATVALSKSGAAKTTSGVTGAFSAIKAKVVGAPKPDLKTLWLQRVLKRQPKAEEEEIVFDQQPQLLPYAPPGAKRV